MAALLALSDERDKSLSLRLAAWREGWQSGHRDGWVAGYARAEADMAAAWQAVAGPVSRGESLIAQGWERRVADATAYSRRRAWAHWHDWQRRNGTEAAS